jgi:hypothetical protein
MNNPVRRYAAVALAILLIVAVGAAIVSSVRDRLGSPSAAVQGVIGSEKLPFFQDSRVIAAFRRGGFDVTVTTAGSRQIATQDLSAQDFAFPAGSPAAEKIRRERTGTTALVPFFTPMAIASWKPIVDLLTQAGVVKQQQGYQTLDMTAYMDLVAADKRWKDLPNNTAYSVNKSILITSTDIRRSNSAAMYLAIASYVANNDSIVQNDSNIDHIVQETAPLFLRQGFVESSSEAPFEDYLVQGMGKSPMVMIYESQFIAKAAANDGTITPEMVLLYPEPTILSKHTFVGLTSNGSRLGEFLASDPELRNLATQFGFRTSDTAGFQTFVTAHQLTAPQTLIDVIEPPSYEAIEAMITRFEQLYNGSLPSPGPEVSP